MPYQKTEFEYWFTFDYLLFPYKYEFTSKKKWIDPVTHEETNHYLVIMSNHEKGFYKGLQENGLWEEYCESVKKETPECIVREGEKQTRLF